MKTTLKGLCFLLLAAVFMLSGCSSIQTGQSERDQMFTAKIDGKEIYFGMPVEEMSESFTMIEDRNKGLKVYDGFSALIRIGDTMCSVRIDLDEAGGAEIQDIKKAKKFIKIDAETTKADIIEIFGEPVAEFENNMQYAYRYEDLKLEKSELPTSQMDKDELYDHYLLSFRMAEDGKAESVMMCDGHAAVYVN